METVTKPKFLSSKPSGRDEMEGKSHFRVAKLITETIIEDQLEKKVIGLEGEWGSGKSNVIKIIESELGSDYHTFIFDSWGSQEDLTRKSFLEQLINELFEKGYLTETKKWEELHNRLLAKSSTTKTEKYPQLKSYWLIFSLVILTFTLTSNIYNNLLKDIDLFEFHFGISKGIISIYLIPFGLFIWGIYLAKREYKNEREKNEDKPTIDKDSKWETIGKMFYWFQGKEINSKETQQILEKEPSVKQFREYFQYIEQDLQGKRLLLVFDNLDRLTADKVKSLWSSIHTFFAEDKKSFNSWVIIPFDHQKLMLHLNEGYNGFIEKTFSVNFRITPPIVTSWEKFLNEKINEAFGKIEIQKEEKDYLVKLFDVKNSSSTMKPRQIINYVNNLVSLYKTWEEELKDGSLRLRYLSLFILTKNEIIINPGQAIVNRSYLGNTKTLFENDPELDTSISMIAFGVKKELADEVLLDRQIKNSLRTGNTIELKSLTNHRAFQYYFRRAYESLELPEKIDGIVEVFEVIEELYEPEIMQALFWKDFAKNILFIDSQFKTFNENHKAILINTDKNLRKDILKRLINALGNNIQSDLKKQNFYYSQIIEIEKYLLKKNINFDIIGLLSNIEFEPESYLEFLKESPVEYQKYKISCKDTNLINFFYDGNNHLNIVSILNYLNELEKIKSKTNFDKINNSLSDNIHAIPYSDKENLKKYITALKALENKPLVLKLSNQFYAQISQSLIESDEIYEDAFCIAISNFQIAFNQSSTFQNLIRNNSISVNKIAKKIGHYFSYDSFLRLIYSNPTASNSSFLKDVLEEITYTNYGDIELDLAWVLKNFDTIKIKAFNDSDKTEKFIRNLDRCNLELTSDIISISKGFFENLKMQDVELIRKITKRTLDHFMNLTKEDFFKSFKEKDLNYIILDVLLTNNLIKTYPIEFYSAFDDYIKDIAKGEIAIPNTYFWNILMDQLNGNKLKSTFTSVRNIFLNEKGELSEQEIYFFARGLIKYGNLITKPEESTLKIIIPMIESDICFDIFIENKNILIEIIKLSDDHFETAKDELQLRLNSGKFNQKKEMEEIAKLIELSLL